MSPLARLILVVGTLVAATLLAIILYAGLLGLALSTRSYAHDSWINHGNYTSKEGVHCCGEHDCSALAPSDVKITPRGYVLTNGELVPFTEAQPSEDGEYWRCKRFDGSRRCFFAPQPSS